VSPWFYLLALIELPVFLWLVYLGSWPLYLMVATIALMGMSELYSALIVKGAGQGAGSRMRPNVGVGCICALLVLATTFGSEDTWPELMIAAVFLTVVASFAAQFSRTGQPGTIRDAAVTILGVLYLAVPLSFMVVLRNMDLALLTTGESAGPVKAQLGAVLMVTAAVWVADTAAWGIGHLIGKTKLAPRLSPNKTVEGALAGAVTAVLVTVAIGGWAGLPLSHGVALGVLIAISSQVGDLAESVIKRDLGIRDFGTVVGPHGGALDTIDGLLFALPMTWLYLWAWFGA
jgi:phosphatidate cytidylyltransferase